MTKCKTCDGVRTVCPEGQEWATDCPTCTSPATTTQKAVANALLQTGWSFQENMGMALQNWDDDCMLYLERSNERNACMDQLGVDPTGKLHQSS